ncbi:MAG: S26 family signal peptidase [Pirellulaceae bacterium]
MRSTCLRLAVLLAVFTACYAVTQSDRLRGMSQSHTVVSGSMAAAILGPHYRQECAECRFTLICGADTTDVRQNVVCPNCGESQSWKADILPQRGDAAWIDTNAPMRRWHVFAYHNDNGETRVKRLIGMPGEQITFKEGDVFANGNRLQKTASQFRHVRQLIHDDRFQPSSENSPQRWRAVPVSTTQWQRTSNGWSFAAAESGDKSVLRYHHFLAYESPLSSDTPQVIQDDCPYNANISRSLNTVDDVAVEADVTLAKETCLLWRFATRSGDVVVRVQGSGHLRLQHGSQHRSWVIYPGRGAKNLLVGICDRQAIWQWGEASGTMELRWRNERHASVTPVEVAASGGRARLTNLRLWRDVYYFRPAYLQRQQTLSRGSWFVLGDNVPVSVDGRHQQGGVRGKRFLGEVNIWPRESGPSK